MSQNIVNEVYHYFNNANTKDFTGLAGKLFGTSMQLLYRAKFFTWLVLHGRIQTLKFLNPINLISNPICAMCGLQKENIDHLFNSCSNAVWRIIAEITCIYSFTDINVHFGCGLTMLILPKVFRLHMLLYLLFGIFG